MATLGNTTAGGSFDLDPHDYLQLSSLGTMPSAGTLQDIQMSIKGATANDTTGRLVIYNDASGKPGTNFAVSAEITIAQNSAQAWYNEAVSGSLANGSIYWAGLWIGSNPPNGNTSSTCPNFAYSASSPSGLYFTSGQLPAYSSTGVAPDLSALTGNSVAEYLSVYIDYTTGGHTPRSPVTSLSNPSLI
jgi:hypothetical protein